MNLERGQWNICMCGGEERQLYSFKFPISPQLTAKQRAWQTNGYDIYWHGRLPGGHRATKQPSSFLTTQSHPDLTITCVWHLYCDPEPQPVIHGGNTGMLTHSLCLYHRAPNSFLKSTERININVCQIPTELTVNIVTVTHDRNLAVMKLKRDVALNEE